MNSLVQWFTQNLSPYISAKTVIFIISLMPILEVRGGLLGRFSFKDSRSGCNPDLCDWQCSADSLYPAFYPADFQVDEEDKDFPSVD